MIPAVTRSAAIAIWSQKPLLAATQAATAKSLEDLAPVAAPPADPPAADDARGQVVDIVA